MLRMVQRVVPNKQKVLISGVSIILAFVTMLYGFSGSLSKDDIKRKEKEDAERRTADMKERINKIAAAAAAKEKKADKDEDEDEDDESSSSDDEKVMDLKAARAEEIERMSFAEKMRLSVMERERERKEKEAKKKAEEELLKKQQEIKKYVHFCHISCDHNHKPLLIYLQAYCWYR